MHSSKLRASFFGACVGVGGADACMMQIINNSHNIDWRGVWVRDYASQSQWEWANRMSGGKVEFHQQIFMDRVNVKGPIYHDSIGEAMYEAAKDSDIIITWCVSNLQDHLPALDVPIVDWAQNTDESAVNCIKTNEKLISYRVACCHAAAAAFGPKYVEDVSVIYNCIDPNRVAPRYGRQYTRETWGLKPEQKVLLYMGRLVDEKYPQGLLTAINELPEEWIGIFVGRGYYNRELYEQAQHWLNDPTRIRFMEPQYQIGDLLAASDCFLLASDFEGHPLSVAEAWLAGLPTVCTRLPVFIELEQSIGRLSHYVDYRPKGSQIADVVLEAVDDIATTSAAREACWQNFTAPAIATQWEEALHAFVHDWRRKKRRPMMYAVAPSQVSTTAERKHHG